MKKRAKMIQYLQVVGDELIKQFKKNELQPVIDNNIYHSLEESETDSENDGKKSSLIICDGDRLQ